jgi:hypothetical protein
MDRQPCTKVNVPSYRFADVEMAAEGSLSGKRLPPRSLEPWQGIPPSPQISDLSVPTTSVTGGATASVTTSCRTGRKVFCSRLKYAKSERMMLARQSRRRLPDGECLPASTVEVLILLWRKQRLPQATIRRDRGTDRSVHATRRSGVARPCGIRRGTSCRMPCAAV